MTATERRRSYRAACRRTGRPTTLEQRAARALGARRISFAQTLARARGAPTFVFFEGPPTANGRPGIHHVFARTIKDLFCRHRAMKGYHVGRKAGWDTHGLPVEIEVEKQLGISGKQRHRGARRRGVQPALPRERVQVRARVGEAERAHRLLARLRAIRTSRTRTTTSRACGGRSRRCSTRSCSYRGHKILPYCPRCGTALSSHEVAQGYQDVEDPSVYHRARARGDAEAAIAGRGARILVWTTTPWTLVSNVGARGASRRSTTSSCGSGRGATTRTIILAEARVRAVLGEDYADRWDVGAHAGRARSSSELRYRRPLDWLPYPAGTNHEVIVGEDFVSADDGTGVVHMAPAFGADDYAAGQRHGLAFLQPVNARGEFPASTALVGGMFVKKADPRHHRGARSGAACCGRRARSTHSYPHCWRCGTPLLYYARDVVVRAHDGVQATRCWRATRASTGIRPRSAQGASASGSRTTSTGRSRAIATGARRCRCGCATRTPTHVDVRSAATPSSRSARATPLPRRLRSAQAVHRRVHVAVRVSGVRWHDAARARGHRHLVRLGVDAVRAVALSVREQGRCWRSSIPADFIAEGVDQTRGWFYSLLAIATGLGRRAAEQRRRRRRRRIAPSS